jgi:hypothetical protein
MPKLILSCDSRYTSAKNLKLKFESKILFLKFKKGIFNRKEDGLAQEHTFIDLINLNNTFLKRNGPIMTKKINQVSEFMNWRINLKSSNLVKIY